MFLKLYCSLLILCISRVFCQNTTNSSQQETVSDLQNRVSILERTVSKMLTGKDNTNLTSINTLKVASGGIPVFNNTPVTFSAKSNSKSGIGPGFILQFPNVINNRGKHYNPTNGIFIAPVHGLYLFHWTMQCRYSGSTHCSTALKINNSIKGKIRSSENGSNYYHSGSKTVFVEVEAGNHVWIENIDYSDVYIYSESSFVGSLLLIL
ncbi:collagen alpha-1(X) chain-like [Saccostrea cucullata]|uniref:collagen alpha-1(X) chain-like n=1 Tax=Saccostrea cuccullata TaxID=36930 RepID=UPI002ECFB586